MRVLHRMWAGAAVVAPAALLVAAARADEPRGLARLFRFGSATTPSSGPKEPSPGISTRPSMAFQPGASFNPASPASTGPSSAYRPGTSFAPPAAPSAPGSVPAYGEAPMPATSPAPSPATAAASPRIAPQPRVSRAATESDPLATRITLGRSDNGQQFAMFLQVFADGTVIDGEGVHRVGRDVLKPLVESIASGELGRVRGHCGGPSTDYVEQVHVTVFDRSLGRLRANSFSYSGNPQGCDHAIRHVNTALDVIQSKISPGAALTASATADAAAFPAATPPPISTPEPLPVGPTP